MTTVDMVQTLDDAIAIIKKQKAEIERLQKENERVKSDWTSQKYLIERMQQGHSSYVEQAKTEAIKEFAERLKENIYIVFEDTERMRVVQEVTIDNLVKEMTDRKEDEGK